MNFTDVILLCHKVRYPFPCYVPKSVSSSSYCIACLEDHWSSWVLSVTHRWPLIHGCPVNCWYTLAPDFPSHETLDWAGLCQLISTAWRKRPFLTKLLSARGWACVLCFRATKWIILQPADMMLAARLSRPLSQLPGKTLSVCSRENGAR